MQQWQAEAEKILLQAIAGYAFFTFAVLTVVQMAYGTHLP